MGNALTSRRGISRWAVSAVVGNALTSSRWISRWAVSAVVGSVGGLSELASRKQTAWLRCTKMLLRAGVGSVGGLSQQSWEMLLRAVVGSVGGLSQQSLDQSVGCLSWHPVSRLPGYVALKCSYEQAYRYRINQIAE